MKLRERERRRRRRREREKRKKTVKMIRTRKERCDNRNREIETSEEIHNERNKE